MSIESSEPPLENSSRLPDHDNAEGVDHGEIQNDAQDDDRVTPEEGEPSQDDQDTQNLIHEALRLFPVGGIISAVFEDDSSLNSKLEDKNEDENQE